MGDEVNRVQCWLCQQWTIDKYTKDVMFEGRYEKVCVKCVLLLKARDAEMESCYEDFQTLPAMQEDGT